METQVPFAVVEIISTRHDRTMKRMCIAFVVAICVLAICTTIMCGFWCKQMRTYHTEEVVTTAYAETTVGSVQ